MARDGTATRALIMDAAQKLILRHGFAATSVEAVLEQTGLTKGAFFHHFHSKNDLARALMERFAEHDEVLLRTTLERAERLTRDPVQQVLVFVGLLEELLEESGNPNPGCLYASYSYEAQLFDDETHGLIERALLAWRKEFGEKIRRALEHRPPRIAVNAEELADGLTVVIEGAYVLSRAFKEPKLVLDQLRHYRNYLEMVFGEAGVEADVPLPASA
jgi:TetR/AcrR family transcriptional repressor of nem operon